MKPVIIIALAFVFFLVPQVYAQSLGMTITVTADQDSKFIILTGHTVSDITDVTFTVISPSGNNVVSIDQISPDNDGNFETLFEIKSTWEENGFYSIKAKQGTSSLYELEALVEVNNGKSEKTSVTESNLERGIFIPNENNVATDAGLFLDAIVVEDSTLFEVTGKTDRVGKDITITVIAPNGNVVTLDQVSPMLDGKFTSVVEIIDYLWKQDGFYTVTVQQFDDPKYIASTKVDVRDGVIVGGNSTPSPTYPSPTQETTDPEPKKLGIASFVDKTKDPKSYVDRYNNEPTYKKWFDDNFAEYDSIEQAVGLTLTEKIPSWVKNIFGWYATDQVSEDELLNAIKYLITEKILIVD